MNESVELARRLDAIYDTELTNRLVSLLSPPSYTLAKLEQLASEYADGSDASGDLQSSEALKFRLYLSMFLAWLTRKEREAR